MEWGAVAFGIVAAAHAGAIAMRWRASTGPRRAFLVLASVVAVIASAAALTKLSFWLVARAGVLDAHEYALVKTLPALAYAATVLAASRIPWRGAWWVLILLPIVSAVAIPPPPSPSHMSADHVENVRMPLAALLACALAPFALAGVPGRPWRPRMIPALGASFLAVYLLLAAYAASGGIPELLFGPGEGPARHAWRVQIEPTPADAAFAVSLPSLEAEPGDEPALRALLATLSVEAGEGAFKLEDNGILNVTGRGRVVLLAERTFYGTSREREAFPGIATANVADLGGTSVRVVYAGDFSGGRGHTCWARWEHVVELDPGESRALLAANDGGMWPRTMICA